MKPSWLPPIWYVLFPILVVALAGYLMYRNWPWWPPVGKYDHYEIMIFPMVLGGIVTAVVIFAAFGAAAVLSSVIGSHLDEVWILRGKLPMVSMRSGDGLNGGATGGLFVMSAWVNSSQVYSYYTLHKDGSFHPNQWTTDADTAVYEEDRTDGELVIYDPVFKHPWMSWLGDNRTATRGEFHIPKGSIRKEFSLK